MENSTESPPNVIFKMRKSRQHTGIETEKNHSKLLEITILKHRKSLATQSLGRFIHLVVINLQIGLAFQLFLVLSCTELLYLL